MPLYLALLTGHVNAHERRLRIPRRFSRAGFTARWRPRDNQPRSPLPTPGHVTPTRSPTSSSAPTHREASASPGRLREFRGIFLTLYKVLTEETTGDLQRKAQYVLHSLITSKCLVCSQVRERGERGAASSHYFSPGCLPGATRASESTGRLAYICFPLL